jgi:DNA helicase II / ATP-dependent DNA helicase PcrA
MTLGERSIMKTAIIDELIASLNPEQKLPATSNHNRIRCMAGPGTGKTKVLQARVANLISINVDPSRILAISFTNESSRESASRIQAACGISGHHVKTGTFHAIANKTLRRYSSIDFFKTKLGYENGFFIIDDDDSKRLMDDAINSLHENYGLLLKEINLDKRALFSRLSRLRSQCLNPTLYAKQMLNTCGQGMVDSWKIATGEIEAASQSSIPSLAKKISDSIPQFKELLLLKVWYEYSKHCKTSNGIDFDDVLVNFYFLLRHNPNIAAKVANEFDHVLIDEYQDTSLIQAMIVKSLINANSKLSLFIVGDSRQSIYDFRGADVRLMTHAEDMFNEFETHELIRNYRSHPDLIAFNNIFAPNMAEQITPGILRSGNPAGFLNNESPPVVFNKFASDVDETMWVINKSKALIESGVEPQDIFVLYRNRSAVKLLEKELPKSALQFEMIGEKNFYERLEVRDAIAFIRALARPKDVLAWARICNCTGIGVRGVYLREKYQETGLPPIEIIQSRRNKKNLERIDGFLEFYHLAKAELERPENNWKELFRKTCHPLLTLSDIEYHIDHHEQAAAEYREWRNEAIFNGLGEVAELYVEYVKESYSVQDERAAKLDETKNASDVTEARIENVISVFREVLVRLEKGEELISITEDLITRDSPQRAERSSSIKLMTGHASKGLEAPHVFLIGCDTGVWGNPNEMSEDARAEEDRVYYVMATRSEQKMYYSMADYRVVNGKGASTGVYSPIFDHIQKGVSQGLVEIINHGKPIRTNTPSLLEKITTFNNSNKSGLVSDTDQTLTDDINNHEIYITPSY